MTPDNVSTSLPAAQPVTYVRDPRPERRVWAAARQAFLLLVGAIEDYLEIPKEKSALVARRLK